MCVLYVIASRVIAWLGLKENNSKLAISFLNNIDAQIIDTINGAIWSSPEATATKWAWFHPETDLLYSQKIS
jgi:hypothetical protein